MKNITPKPEAKRCACKLAWGHTGKHAVTRLGHGVLIGTAGEQIMAGQAVSIDEKTGLLRRATSGDIPN